MLNQKTYEPDRGEEQGGEREKVLVPAGRRENMRDMRKPDKTQRVREILQPGMLPGGVQEPQIMMIFGMLYFDGSYKLSDVELIDVARKAYERKTTSKACLALLQLNTEDIPEVEGLQVMRSHLVRPHHTIVGIPVDDKLIKLTSPESQ
jgi:hypothetical protein